MVRLPGFRTAAVAVVGVCALAVFTVGASAHNAASGTVVFANTSSVQKLDPDVVTNFLDFQALRLIYDTLVTYNTKLQLTPDLATSWSFSNGGKTITFQLRKNVKFTDGTTFTSANVVASLNRVKDPKTADAASSFIASVTKIVPAGTYAVKLLLSRPDTSVLDGLTSLNLAMPVRPVDLRPGRAGENAGRHGPVRVRELEPEQLLHRQGQPELLGRQGDRCRAGRDWARRSRASNRSPRRSRRTRCRSAS